MNNLDKHYLLLQFKEKISTKSGTEFQSFFENIMEKAFLDFQKIRPYGNKGDGGNDGYTKTLGVYYQVYAPSEPKTNELEASKKLKKDFNKLYKSEWDKIALIKEYNFVFNDKYSGSTQELEKVISELEIANPSVKFKLFVAKNLEKVFFELEESDILSLGFNIDRRLAIDHASNYLETIKNELDKEDIKYSQKMLENVNSIILSLNDEKLSIEYEVLECRCLHQLEKIDEAKAKYESLIKRFPKDPRAFLYLAEIYLNDKDFNKNLDLLQKAEQIDKDFWLLKLEKLVRNLHLEEKIDLEKIDETNFSRDPKIKSNFYRLYALFFEYGDDQIKADSFIEKAIYANPERFSNHLIKLAILEKRFYLGKQDLNQKQQAQELFEGITKVENKFIDISIRNKVILSIKKLKVLYILEKFPEFAKVSKETFELLINCYFDNQIDQFISIILKFVSLHNDDLNKLLEYIKNQEKKFRTNFQNFLFLNLIKIKPY